MSYLDQIIKRMLIDTPVTVNTAYISDHVSLDSIQDQLSIDFRYESGSSADMTFFLAFSDDGINFSRDVDTQTTIDDSSGYLLFDFAGSGSQFVRIEIDVSAGSIDAITSMLIGKRLH